MSEVFLFPTSFAQQRLWFLDQMSPGTPFYNITTGVQLNFPVSIDLLQQCVDEIVRRHEVLRTHFIAIQGQPYQVIAPALAIPIATVDLSDAPPDQQEVMYQNMIQQEVRQGFHLMQGPLVRVKLIKLHKARYLLLISMHHIISDGWSIGIFFRELEDLYESLSLHRPARLPALPIQYADYAVWQRSYLKEEVLQKQLTYWKKQLEGIDELALPTDLPRPPVQSYQGAFEQLLYPQGLYTAVKELSVKEGVTPFMTLLACFTLLLHRYTNQTDIIVGTPVAGRNRAELENLIGFFINTLVLRTDLGGNPTFVELLSRVRQASINAFSQQDLPFEKLVEELQVKRDLSRNPLFQVTFQLINTATLLQQRGAMQNNSGTNTSPKRQWNVQRGTAMFDFAFDLAEVPEGLLCQIEYSTALFKAETIRKFLNRYQFLLESIVAMPKARLTDLRYFPKEEQQALSAQQNTDPMDPPPRVCLHHWLEEKADVYKDRVAVIFEDRQLTFAELNERANDLAEVLIQSGLKPGSIVGVGLVSPLDFVIAILAVLKAGGAFLPIDPDYPSERLHLLKQAAQKIIGDAVLQAKLEVTADELLLLDDLSNKPLRPAGNPVVPLSPDHLAYVLFTSGSTGKPKGVMVSHHAIVNHMHWMMRNFPLTPDDRVIQRTAFSFDASIWEIFAPLLEGAQLVLMPRSLRADSEALAALLTKEKITVLQVVPTLLKVLVDLSLLKGNRYLKRVFCGGEVLHTTLTQSFLQQFPVELINLYGPTETTIDATYSLCQLGEENDPVPIGRPVSQMRVYVLDPYLNPVPAGVKGEIYLSGAGLARGYLHQPGMTAERFLPDPYSNIPGSRMYRTGDLGKWLANGEVQYLGRTDNQVKLRGYRIELGEIETALTEHPHVKQAVVMLREDMPGFPQLVTYFVGATAETDTSELQQFVKKRLPSYMVPGVWIPLEVLPLTSSGKVDRQRLPVPDTSASAWVGGMTTPRNALEKVMTDIWSDVLGLDNVGIRHNFFSDLGGHSLLATQLISRVRDLLQVEVLLQRIFEYPTVSEFSEMILREAAHPEEIEARSKFLLKINHMSEEEVERILQNGDDKQPM